MAQLGRVLGVNQMTRVQLLEHNIGGRKLAHNKLSSGLCMHSPHARARTHTKQTFLQSVMEGCTS